MALDNSKLISDVVDRLKKQGLFDKFRKECMADVDTKVKQTLLRLQVYKLNHTLVLRMRDVGVALRVRGQRL